MATRIFLTIAYFSGLFAVIRAMVYFGPEIVVVAIAGTILFLAFFVLLHMAAIWGK